jgi:hypothetical protein
MSQIIKISAEDEEVILNTEHLMFTDATLNDYLIKAPGWFAYYNQAHARAQYVSSIYEDMYDQVYSEKFRHYKAAGGSDKLAEASARVDPDVIEALKRTRKAKENMNQIAGHLRSLDKANQNALNLGYNIRKEMDKLGVSIREKSLEEIMGSINN